MAKINANTHQLVTSNLDNLYLHPFHGGIHPPQRKQPASLNPQKQLSYQKISIFR